MDAALGGCALRVAAVAPVSGAFFGAVEATCSPRRSVLVLEFHGSADHVVPYSGGGSGTFPPVPRWLSGWAARDGCSRAGSIFYEHDGATGEKWTAAQGTHWWSTTNSTARATSGRAARMARRHSMPELLPWNSSRRIPWSSDRAGYPLLFRQAGDHGLRSRMACVRQRAVRWRVLVVGWQRRVRWAWGCAGSRWMRGLRRAGLVGVSVRVRCRDRIAPAVAVVRAAGEGWRSGAADQHSDQREQKREEHRATAQQVRHYRYPPLLCVARPRRKGHGSARHH